METYRPRIYYSTESELTAWEEIIAKIREIGALSFDMLLNPKTGSISTEETENSLNIDLRNTTIQTKEELIKACNIDTKEWEVSGFKVSTWQQREDGVQLYAVKCTFRRISNSSLNAYIKKLEEGLISHVKSEIKHNIPTAENVAIINIFDSHLDKVTRETETGENCTIEKNCNIFRAAVDYLLLQVGSPELIIFPVGNDLFNVNDCRGTTKKGTPQDTYLNHIDAFEIGLNLIIECVEKMAKIAPLYVPIVAGNHAEDLENILGVCLKTIYGSTSTIEVDATRKERKYKAFGNNLFMFSHGDKLKRKIQSIPSIMAVEKPELWADAVNRYAIFGDIHHEQTHELNGVTAMFLRSMSALDKWHHAQGYVGSRKTAYAFTFSRCGKYTSTSTINF